MGKETIPRQKPKAGKPGKPSKPGEYDADAVLAAAALRLKAGADGRGEGGGDSRPERPDQRHDAHGTGQPPADATATTGDHRRAQTLHRRKHLRRILGRAEDLRRTVRDLNEAVAGAEADGLSRQAIIDAIYRTYQDMRDDFKTMAESAELLKAIGSPAQFDVIRVDSIPVASTAALEMIAAEDGLYASQMGRRIDANPHGTDRPRERKAWRIGFNCGQAGIELPDKWDLEKRLTGI